MTTARLICTLTLVYSACIPIAGAQTTSPAPVLTPAPTTTSIGTAASAPLPARPAPRSLSNTERRDSATSPGALRPVDPVLPQINVPLGRGTGSTPDSAIQISRPVAASVAGGIDDSIARCKAQDNKVAQAECVDREARADRKR